MADAFPKPVVNHTAVVSPNEADEETKTAWTPLRPRVPTRKGSKKQFSPKELKKLQKEKLKSEELAIREAWKKKEESLKQEEHKVRAAWKAAEEVKKQQEAQRKKNPEVVVNDEETTNRSKVDVNDIGDADRPKTLFRVASEESNETSTTDFETNFNNGPTSLHQVVISVTEESSFHERIWGDALNSTDNDIPMRLRAFIDRPTTEEEATKILVHAKTGSCIIRVSGVVVSQNGDKVSPDTDAANEVHDFTLSVKRADGIIWHCTIEKLTRKGKFLYVLENEQVPPPIFGSLQDLVKYFTSHPYYQNSYIAVEDGVLDLRALEIVALEEAAKDEWTKAEDDVTIVRSRSDSMARHKQHRGTALTRLQGYKKPTEPVIKEEHEEIRKRCCFKTPAVATYFIVFYFLLGMLFYTQYMGWSASYTFYFIIVVITTVGYGDHDAIEGTGPLLFTTFFVFFGVSLVVASLSLIIKGLIINRRKLRRVYRQKIIQKMLRMRPDKTFKVVKVEQIPSIDFDDMDYVAPKPLPKDKHPKAADNDTSADEKEKPHEPKPSRFSHAQRWLRHHPICQALVYMSFLIPIGIIFGTQSRENFSFVESLYWIVITGTTVGFGDYSPVTEEGQWFMAFFMLPLVIVVGNLINEISLRVILGYKDTTEIQPEAVFDDLSEELVTGVFNGDQVTKDEWLKAMLVATGVVDAELCDMIIAYFDRHDSDGDGLLTRRELERAIDRDPLSEADQDDALATVQFMDGIRQHLSSRSRAVSAGNRHGYRNKFEHLSI
eukprot:m.228646 g.228646  ORF g.228646 m.228646 type:complete len:776 (-) comp33543_c1_seq1:158-2485(-)